MTDLPEALQRLPNLVAGSLDRLKGVSQHAKKAAEGGPEHLWVGMAIAGALVVVVGLAVCWTASRKK